jgi:hypothetical protein
MSILTIDKITEIFCVVNDFCKNFQPEMEKLQKLPEQDRKHRNRPCGMSDSEIITILLLFHIGHFKNFKHFYLACVQGNLRKEFPKQLSYSRFIQTEHRVFVFQQVYQAHADEDGSAGEGEFFHLNFCVFGILDVYH